MAINVLPNITEQTDKQKIEEFIFNSSPFTKRDTNFETMLKKFFDDNMDTPITISMQERIRDRRNRIEKIMFFLVWIGYNGNQRNLYAGTEYIDSTEFQTGINLGKLQVEL